MISPHQRHPFHQPPFHPHLTTHQEPLQQQQPLQLQLQQQQQLLLLQQQLSHHHLQTAPAARQHPRYEPSHLFAFDSDQPLYEFQPEHYTQSSSRPLMQSEHSHGWLSTGQLSNGQLTPTSANRGHYRESSLSSRGSAGPASPYTANTSNPQVAGDLYNDYHEYQHTSSKPLTPAHTPLQEHFLHSNYSQLYPNSNLPFGMSQEAPTRSTDLMSAPEFSQSGRPSRASVATNDSRTPSTPPSFEEERRKNGETSDVDFWLKTYLQACDDEVYRSSMPKLDRTMTDIYADELYNPNIQITSISQATTLAPTVVISPQNDVFSQRLQAANSQHLSASNTQTPLTIPPRERSPFRQGSPLAPTASNFGSQSPNVRFGTATHMREQQKAEADARALQQQLERTSPGQATASTISPKDVDLVYRESEEDANTPLFPPPPQRLSPAYRPQTSIAQEQSESDDNTSQRSYGSMATSRRESSSAFSSSSQPTQQHGINFTPPAVPGSIRRIPQQYPFIPQSRRQTSNLSNVAEEFPVTLTSMESSSSEYAPGSVENKKPSGASADTGTYTCTYHGCTLRFDTPAKLQKHKREGHRNSTSALSSGGDEKGGMTSAAQRNSQAGPHKCERINPSTGKPCNTIFSRPYDLTRHEDTIHNARKQKVYCPICTEEKSFSRNDALTRHLRVVHPQYADSQQAGRRRRGGS